MTLYCGNYETLEILITLYGFIGIVFGAIVGFLICKYKYTKQDK